MKLCCIFGASNCDGACTGGSGCIVIAADGGYKYLTENGIVPDLTVGDFDSLGYVPCEDFVIVHPAEKDDTDTMLAVKKGIAAGCDTFVVYGGLGGRLDHTLANIQLLSYICEKGCEGYLAGEGQVLTVTDRGLSFAAGMRGIISVFAVSGTPTVSIRGLKYPLDNYPMSVSYPIGVSNEFTSSDSEIAVCGGTVLIMWSQTPAELIERLSDE